MEFQKTQLGRILEDVKRVMLAHIPIVYIPTAQVEIIQELLYGKNCIDSLVPRVCFKDGETVKLAATEIGGTDGLTGTFKSIVDNYKVGGNPDSIKTPSILVSYVTDWSSVTNSARNYISLYLGIKKSENQTNPKLADAVRRSLYIIVSPKEEAIPDSIAPYVRTVRVPSLSDEEIETIILDKLKDDNIPAEVISSHLLSQMIISFRGFSTTKIVQLLNLMVAEQYIEFDYPFRQKADAG